MVSSPVVTAWPERLLLTGGFLLLAVLAAWLMRWGWRSKLAAQADLPLPASVPVDFVGDFISGKFVGSNFAGDWLARVVAHGLGLPGRAELGWGVAGLVIRRAGGLSWFIPRADLGQVRADRAAAGKVYETDGMIVVKWRLGDTWLESGFRADSTADHLRCLSGFTVGGAA